MGFKHQDARLYKAPQEWKERARATKLSATRLSGSHRTMGAWARSPCKYKSGAGGTALITGTPSSASISVIGTGAPSEVRFTITAPIEAGVFSQLWIPSTINLPSFIQAGAGSRTSAR